MLPMVFVFNIRPVLTNVTRFAVVCFYLVFKLQDGIQYFPGGGDDSIDALLRSPHEETALQGAHDFIPMISEENERFMMTVVEPCQNPCGCELADRPCPSPKNDVDVRNFQKLKHPLDVVPGNNLPIDDVFDISTLKSRSILWIEGHSQSRSVGGLRPSARCFHHSWSSAVHNREMFLGQKFRRLKCLFIEIACWLCIGVAEKCDLIDIALLHCPTS